MAVTPDTGTVARGRVEEGERDEASPDDPLHDDPVPDEPVPDELVPDELVIAGRAFASRLFLGTGKFPSNQHLAASIRAICQLDFRSQGRLFPSESSWAWLAPMSSATIGRTGSLPYSSTSTFAN